jgi:hypothetical protein
VHGPTRRTALRALGGSLVCGAGVVAAFGGAGAIASTSTFPTPTVPTTTIASIPATTVAPTTSTSATPTAPTTTSPETTATTPTATVPASPGKSIRLRPRTRAGGCRAGMLPDRRCSPGALYAGATKAVVCSPSFDPGRLDAGTAALRRRVVAEYGLARSGRGLELDRIVPAALGGSNDIANLWPERAPGYRLKDRLETKLRGLVCSGGIELHAAQVALAVNWTKLYVRVFGIRPNL